jgi:hypothetical protein
MELLIFLIIFGGGYGAGYYVRDRISKKRRERYLAAKRGQELETPHLLSFRTNGISDMSRSLRRQPPIE